MRGLQVETDQDIASPLTEPLQMLILAPSILSLSNPLPVELLNFTASLSGKVVVLKWQTASEKNNDYFTVKRSSDGAHFINLFDVDGAGNSNTVTSYRAIDPSPPEDVVYYQLKQTDMNGDWEEFNIVSIKVNNTDATFIESESVFPNPFKDQFQLQFLTDNNIQLKIDLYNNSGVSVYSDGIQTRSGLNSIKIDEEQLPPGIYILVLTDKENHKKSIRLVKTVS